MKYGMPTLVECEDIVACVTLARELGLDFVEINTSFPQYQTEVLDVEMLRRLAKDNNIFYTIHADEGLNPFDFNKSVSECYFNEMKKHIRFALSIASPVINMHLMKGVYVTLPGKVILLNDVYREQYLERVRAFIRLCEDEIGDKSLKIAIENVDSNPFTDSQREALKLFMASPVFFLTLDTGHDECLGGADRDVFERYGERLVHLHLHDSDGKSAHLPLGKGRIDIGEKLALLSGDKTVLLEVKTIEGLKVSVNYLINCDWR